MKTTNFRFYLLLVLTTLMGCALGHASSSPAATPNHMTAGDVASARHIVAFAE